MADLTIDYSALTTANPYVLPAPMLFLGGGNVSSAPSATNAFQVTNGSGIKIGTYSVLNAVAWAVHNVTYGNLITSEITIPAATFGGDVVGPGIFIRSGTGVGAGYVARADGSALYIDSLAATGVVTQLSSVGGVTFAASDVIKLTFNQTSGDLNVYQNGTLKSTVTADNTYTSPQRALMGAGFYIEWGNLNAQYIKIFAGTGVNSAPTGSGATTEGSGDTASGTGATTVSGTGASTEGGADTAGASGSVSTPTIVDVATLTSKTVLTGAEIFAAEDTGPVAKGVTSDAIKAWINTAYAVLTSDYALTNSTAVQKAFNHSTNGTVTLPVGTYEFQALLHVENMSATSGNAQFDLKGAGTAVIGTVTYNGSGVDSSTVTAAAAQSGALSTTVGSAASIVTAAVGTGLGVLIDGTFVVTTAGTIIPSIALVTANAASMKAGSFFKLRLLGASNFGGPWS